MHLKLPITISPAQTREGAIKANPLAPHKQLFQVGEAYQPKKAVLIGEENPDFNCYLAVMSKHGKTTKKNKAQNLEWSVGAKWSKRMPSVYQEVTPF